MLVDTERRRRTLAGGHRPSVVDRGGILQLTRRAK